MVTINQLQKILDSGDLSLLKDIVEKSKKKSPTKRTTKKTTNKVPPSGRKWKQTWHDDLQEHSDELVTKNPKLGTSRRPNKKNLFRNKATNKMVSVECSICHKKEKVDPIFATSYNTDPTLNTYKCDNCCQGLGR